MDFTGMDLAALRTEIDNTDGQILSLFLHRMGLVSAVADYKAANSIATLDSGREQAILDRVTAQSGDLSVFSQELFRTLFRLSREYQDSKRLLNDKTLSKNVFFIGMPGSGKTEIGHRTAQMLNMGFLDTDDIITKKISCTIQDYFAVYGEEAFRRVETEVLRDCASKQGFIIATGGGIVLSQENRQLLTSGNFVILLNRDIGSLAMNGRPLSKGHEVLEEMYKFRRPLYLKAASVEVDNNGTIPQTVANAVSILTSQFEISVGSSHDSE